MKQKSIDDKKGRQKVTKGLMKIWSDNLIQIKVWNFFGVSMLESCTAGVSCILLSYFIQKQLY